MICGVCTECGDTYPLPQGLVEGEQYVCARCGRSYKLKIVSMYEFVFNRLISTKGN